MLSSLQFEEVLSYARIPPVVNQVELHPLLAQRKLVGDCLRKVGAGRSAPATYLQLPFTGACLPAWCMLAQRTLVGVCLRKVGARWWASACARWVHAASQQGAGSSCQLLITGARCCMPAPCPVCMSQAG